MRILTTYILRQTLGPFFATVFIFLLALSLERLLRLVDDVTTYNASLLRALELLMYLIPHYLGLAIPAALFIGVMLATRHFYERSELSVMKATGHDLSTIYKPVLSLSAVMAALLILLSGYAQPHSRYEYRAQLNELKSSPQTLPIRANVFIDFGEDIVFRADMARPKENYMGGFFASYIDHLGVKTYVTSEHAYVEQGNHERPLSINMINGEIVKYNKNTEPKYIKFENYPWQPKTKTDEYGARGQDERELTLHELITRKTQNENASKTAYTSEFHARLVQAFSLPFLCLLAIPLALLGQGRTGKASGLVLGVIGLIAYEKILGFGEAFAAEGSLSPYIGLWGPWLILTTLAFFTLKSQEKKR